VIRLVLIFLFSLFLTGQASACSCGRFENAEEHIQRTDVIFEGIALKTKSKGFLWWKSDDQQTHFQVIRTFKGQLGRAETIIHHNDPDICCICGVEFTKSETYLIFAHQNEDGTLYTNSCSGPQFPHDEYEAIFSGNAVAAD